MHKVKHFTLGVAGAAMLAAALGFAPAAFDARPVFDFTTRTPRTPASSAVAGRTAPTSSTAQQCTRTGRASATGTATSSRTSSSSTRRHVEHFRHWRVDSVQVAQHRHDSSRSWGTSTAPSPPDNRRDVHRRSGQRGRLAGDRPRRRHVLSERRRDAPLLRPHDRRLLFPRRDVCCDKLRRLGA